MKQTRLTDRTTVVNKNRSEYDVYIGRNSQKNGMNTVPVGEPGWIGNPYPKAEYGLERCIELFHEDFHARLESDEEFREAVENLRGKTLGCWCKPDNCHGDVIVEWLSN